MCPVQSNLQEKAGGTAGRIESGLPLSCAQNSKRMIQCVGALSEPSCRPWKAKANPALSCPSSNVV